MRQILEIAASRALLTEMDAGRMTQIVSDSLQLTGRHQDPDASLVCVVPRREWLLIGRDRPGNIPGTLLLSLDGARLRGFELYRHDMLNSGVGRALQRGDTEEVRAWAGALGAMIGPRAKLLRRVPTARRYFGMLPTVEEVAARPSWTLTDPESRQTLALWALDDAVLVAWVTFTGESPHLRDHKVFWTGRYGLSQQADRSDLLMDGRDRPQDEAQRRRWDYFFPPLVHHLPHRRRLARREITEREFRDEGKVTGIRSMVILTGGLILATFAESIPLILTMVVGTLLLSRYTVRHLITGWEDEVVDPLLPLEDIRWELASTGGVRTIKRVLYNRAVGSGTRALSLRSFVDAIRADIEMLGRSLRRMVENSVRMSQESRGPIGWIAMIGRAVAVVGPIVMLLMAQPAGSWALPVVLLFLLARAELGRWLQMSKAEVDPLGLWGSSALALTTIGAATMMGYTAFGYVGVAVALLGAERFRRLDATRVEIRREIAGIEWERIHLESQVPDDVPGDDQMDRWWEEDLCKLDQDAMTNLDIDPERLCSVRGYHLGSIDPEEEVLASLDRGRVPEPVLAFASEEGEAPERTVLVVRPGRQWGIIDGCSAHTVTLRHKKLHIFRGEDINPLGLRGVMITSWGVLQPDGDIRKEAIAPERIWAYRVGGDRRLRYAVTYVQLIYFSPEHVFASGFFHDRVSGRLGRNLHANTAEYTYAQIVGLTATRRHNEDLAQLESPSGASIHTTVFALEVSSGRAVDVALTDESLMSARLADRGEAGRETQHEAAAGGEGGTLPLGLADAHPEELGIQRSAAVINFVRREWRKQQGIA